MPIRSRDLSKGLRHSTTTSRRLLVWFGLTALFIIQTKSEAFPTVNVPISREVSEPIFGLWFDPREIHFDTIPIGELLPNCKEEIEDQPFSRKAPFLYATYKSSSANIYVVGDESVWGIYVLKGGRECYTSPANVVLSQTHYKMIGPGNPPLLDDSDLRGLFDDALARYTRVFGGKKRFFQWLDVLTSYDRKACKGYEPLCPPTYHTLSSTLQHELDNYRKN